MLRDRAKIAKLFEFLYKTLLTFRSQSFSFTTRKGEKVSITFEVADTMVLLPPSHRSLGKAATLLLNTDYHKKELSNREKSNMLGLLTRNRARFEDYAVHDAVITLMLFLKLQYLFNIINGTTSKRYATIGSATVHHFERFMKETYGKNTFLSQFNRSNETYQKHLSLIRRSYKGGINNSYYIGKAKDRVFLDIDFSSAYPTVMNMLRFGSFGVPLEKTSAPVRVEEFAND